jgi:mevalonate kinase
VPAISATAPGKIILFGEHAVVYGRPAIAAPLSEIQARAIVTAEPRRPAGQVIVDAPDIGLQADRADLSPDHPLRMALDLAQAELGVARPPACTVRITSTIAVASGLGSGAAVSVALIRAFSSFLGHPLPDERVSALAYEVEKLHHGTPSGIDNSVIAYALPVFFVRGEPIHVLRLPQSFHLVVADTGIASPTAVAVGDVRRARQTDPRRYEALFDAAGRIAHAARRLIESGRPAELGPLMDENHAVLQEMGVSCPELDALVQAARGAGALGAKLSGGGRGGNMLALVEPRQVEPVLRALISAGAKRAFGTQVRSPKGH